MPKNISTYQGSVIPIPTYGHSREQSKPVTSQQPATCSDRTSPTRQCHGSKARQSTVTQGEKTTKISSFSKYQPMRNYTRNFIDLQLLRWDQASHSKTSPEDSTMKP
ncbi:hypothetical protein Tco_1067314 [Tanacetum coccineum]|uniref:Uncharacterized protein n=1 Tax=Tanacetum coccineum TaxID=301880 RepID=A0ABQ5HEE2_9ASTR